MQRLGGGDVPVPCSHGFERHDALPPQDQLAGDAIEHDVERTERLQRDAYAQVSEVFTSDFHFLASGRLPI